MKLKALSVAVGVSMYSALTLASPYQAEVSATYLGGDNYDGVRLEGEWHFMGAVNTARHPLAEAAFIERSSNISLDYTYRDYDEVSTDRTNVELEYFVPNTMFYVGAGFHNRDGDNDWSVTLGVTPIHGLLVTTRYYGDDGYNLNLAARYFTELPIGNALSVRAEYQDQDEDDFVSLEADFYMDRTLSVGAIIENRADTDFGVRTRKFFTPVFSGQVSYMARDNGDEWTLGVSYRF